MAALSYPRARKLVFPKARALATRANGGAVSFVPPTMDGVAPVAGGNFKTGQFVGGVNPFSGTSGLISAAGLTINTGNNVDCTAATLAGMVLNYTWVFVLAGRAGAVNAGVLGQSATESPIFLVGPTGVARAYKSPTNLDNGNRFSAGGKRRIAMARTTTGRKITQNGCPLVSDATVQTVAPSAMAVGRFNGASYVNDEVEEAWLYAFYATDAGMKAATMPTFSSPLATPYLRGLDTHYIDYGISTLKREADLPWSMITLVRKTGVPDLSGAYLGDMGFTSVSAAASIFPGYETWFSFDGTDMWMHIRIISNFGTPSYIGVKCKCNGLLWSGPYGGWNVLGWRYDGSRTAAGIDFFINGVKQLTKTIESDTLGANTILTDPQRFVISNQTNRLNYYGKEDTAYFQFRGDAPNDAFFAAHALPATLPTDYANAILHPDFANISGTSVPDLSPSGLTGTLSTTELMLAA